MSTGRTPKWESELWSYIGSSDGKQCTRVSCCQHRHSGKWCISDNLERIKLLLDARGFKFSDYDFIKPAGRCRISLLLEILAQEWLKKGGVCCPPVPTELIMLADEYHSIEVRQLPLKVHHGAVWRVREGWIIQIKDGDTSARKRFTLFHEAFHILAHCSNTTPVFRRGGIEGGSFNELVADGFAGRILMPGEWVKEKWVEVNDLNQIAKIFDVPKSAMCVRLKRLGLV